MFFHFFIENSNYIVLQNPVSDRAHPANSETLQCSVLSESEGKLCSGELSVFWFRAGSGQSYPEIIHTNEKGPHYCENTSSLNTQKKCTYSLSKHFSSSGTSDTLYCAVATCGEILFGSKNYVEIQGSSLWSQETIISIITLSAALVISLTGMAVLLCSINRCKCEYHQDAVNLEKNCGQNRQQTDEDRRMYSAVIFTMMKTDTATQMMFAAVKPFSL
ncbi:hypothetical protein ILYODFUR_035088 [Ilyodon furcidens]|uniref:Ig-like domain-containing protein n=1 Tax=Ilyodon furcidens TaxID=33524 RepID=A0ABV0T2R0_9TELE